MRYTIVFLYGTIRPQGTMRILLLGLLLCCLLISAWGLAYAPYDATVAKAGAILSGLAYCSDSYITSFLCKQCDRPEVSHFSVNALLYSSTSDLHGFTGAFVDEAKKHVSLAVVFRGSYSIQNWVDDLTVKQVAYRPDKAPNMLIHEGFLNAYMSVDPQAQSSIQSMIEKYSSSYSLDLTCIGHSLGAACAQVACLQLMSQKAIADAIQPQNVFLYNYGQPRVGNAAFAQWAESQFGAYYRLTHWRDLVPHVPLELATENGYKHGGVEVWYTEDFSNHTVCTVGEDGKCSDSIADVSIPDHLDYLNTPLSGMSYCGPA